MKRQNKQTALLLVTIVCLVALVACQCEPAGDVLEVEGQSVSITRFRSVNVQHDLDVDGTANLDDMDIDLSGEFEVDGGLTDFGGCTADVADGDNDVCVAAVLEVDGELELDGTLDADSTSNFADTATFSKGSGDAVVISAGGVLSMPATADISAYGYVAIGNGTPDGSVTAGTNEQLYVEGALEVDGELEADGAIDADSDLDVDGTSNLDDVDIDLSASLNIDGHMVDIGTCTTPSTADGDNDLCVAGDAEVDGELELDGALDADSTANFADTVTFSKGSGQAMLLSAGGVFSAAATADIYGYGYTAFGDGTPDGSVTAGTDEQVYVEGAFEVDGEAEFDGAIDADSTSNFADTATFSKGSGNAILVSAGGTLTLAVTADLGVGGYAYFGDGTPDGSVTAGTDEQVYIEGALEVDGELEADGAIDADSTADFADTVTFSKGSGQAMLLSAGGVFSAAATADIYGYGYVAIGNGTPDGSVTAGTDEALYVEGALEVDGELEADGAIDADSTLSVAGAATFANDVTISAVTDGGNQGAINQYIGIPKIKLQALAQGTNPAAETVDCMDSTPTGEWTEVDAGTNLVVTADTGYYRYDTNSIKLAFTDVVDNDGVSVAIPAQDDLSGLESVGFWIYSDVTITSGDFDLTVDDSDGTDQVYSIGAVTANIWTWVEVDISGCDANCDTTDNLIILATAQGGTTHTAANIYIDELFYWDSVDEDALSTSVLRDGVISCVDTEGGVSLSEYTDYIVHEESGNDFIVYITDQSAADVVCLLAY